MFLFPSANAILRLSGAVKLGHIHMNYGVEVLICSVSFLIRLHCVENATPETHILKFFVMTVFNGKSIDVI